MAAPILWTSRISVFFLQENLRVHKIPRFRGVYFGLEKGVSADFIFMGAGIFLTKVRDIPPQLPGHPRFPPSKPKENKLLRAGTNFSTTTPSRGGPPPHPAVSGPKKLKSLCSFFWPTIYCQFMTAQVWRHATCLAPALVHPPHCRNVNRSDAHRRFYVWILNAL